MQSHNQWKLSTSYHSQTSRGWASRGTSALFTSLKIFWTCNCDQTRKKKHFMKSIKQNLSQFKHLPYPRPHLVFRTQRPDAVDLFSGWRSEQVELPMARQHPLRKSQQKHFTICTCIQRWVWQKVSNRELKMHLEDYLFKWPGTLRRGLLWRSRPQDHCSPAGQTVGHVPLQVKKWTLFNTLTLSKMCKDWRFDGERERELLLLIFFLLCSEAAFYCLLRSSGQSLFFYPNF